MRIVMLGPPASGKGTQGVRLAAKAGAPHVSTGALLRASIRARDPLGIGAIVAGGALVPDRLVERLLRPALGASFILDGYPRTLAQAVRLDELLAERGFALDGAVEIAVDPDALAARMAGRARMEARPDDRPEAFARRMAEYGVEAPALREHYAGRLITVDGDGTPDEVHARLLEALRGAGATGWSG